MFKTFEKTIIHKRIMLQWFEKMGPVNYKGSKIVYRHRDYVTGRKTFTSGNGCGEDGLKDGDWIEICESINPGSYYGSCPDKSFNPSKCTEI